MADRAPHIEAALKWFGEQDEEERARIIARAHHDAIFVPQGPRVVRWGSVRIAELVEVQSVSIDVASPDGRTTGAIAVLPSTKDPERFTVRAPGPLEAVLSRGDLKTFSDALQALIEANEGK